MASQWYYTKDGEKAGPVASVELKRLARSGLPKPTDLIWKEGMADWVPANKAQNLFPEEGIVAQAPMPALAPRPAAARTADAVPEYELAEVLDDPPSRASA